MKLHFLIVIFSVLVSCKKEKKQDEPPQSPNCNSIAILFSANVRSTTECSSEGRIEIITSPNSGYLFKLNNGSFQTTTVFENLRPGKYAISVQSKEGCIKTDSITVGTIVQTPGFLFTEVKNLIAANCFTCHTGANPQGGLNFADNCTIVQAWDRIKARAVDGNPSPMPQQGLMPLSERNKITAWINAGHRLTD